MSLESFLISSLNNPSFKKIRDTPHDSSIPYLFSIASEYTVLQVYKNPTYQPFPGITVLYKNNTRHQTFYLPDLNLSKRFSHLAYQYHHINKAWAIFNAIP